MPAAALPSDENERLLDLHRYEVLDTLPEQAFDGITQLAGQLAEVPFALISLTDGSRQWFKSRVGISAAEVPREWAPCAHVVYERSSILCEDTQRDSRFADNPLVTGPPHVRFYAGIALRTPRGTILGTLALMDLVPRRLTTFQLDALKLLAQQIVDQLELRKTYRDLERLRAQEKMFEARLQREKTEEAQRMAAELHDGIGQDLTGISILVSALQRRPVAQQADIREPLAEVSGLLGKAIESCRRVAEAHGGFLVRQEGVTGALRHFVQGLKEPGIQVEFSGTAVPAHCLDEMGAYHLFRIAHEAVMNACHHSGGTRVRVSCQYSDEEVVLAVEDNGLGLSDMQQQPAGIGRSIMAYRAKSIGATLTFSDAPCGGLRVECRLPCQTRGASDPVH